MLTALLENWDQAVLGTGKPSARPVGLMTKAFAFGEMNLLSKHCSVGAEVELMVLRSLVCVFCAHSGCVRTDVGPGLFIPPAQLL